MIPVPNLDTIAFDALVEEGRALIPRYAPDWTDHNLHDPGITLLDLLAWIVDQQVYRIGAVGDAHLRAFAALLGVRPKSAEPALGLLWPPAKPPPNEKALPAGTRAWPVHQPQLIFTSSAPARLSAARIRTMTALGTGKAVRVEADGSGAIRLDPLTQSLELSLDRPLFADATDASTLALGLEFADALPDLGPSIPVPIAFDYRTSDGIWHRAVSRWKDGGARRSGAALVDIASGHNDVAALRLDFRGFPVSALPTRLALNVLPLVQIETLVGLKLGEGLGLPDLELPLGAGALPKQKTARNKLKIQTLESGKAITWTPVEDLARSGPEERDYVLDEARGTIRFGNGVNGLMPPAGRQIDRDALDVTAGVQGNLAVGVEWAIEGVASAAGSWTNRGPMAGGRDAWDREALLTAVRRRSRKRMAMLTDAELRDAATGLEGFGLERAEVLPRFLPTLPHRPVPGARTLLLHPGDGVQGSEAWVDAIERRLASRRVLGERLSLAAAELVTIAVAAELLIASGSDAPSIREAVETVLKARLSAFRKSPTIEPWPSGRPVTIGELEALVAGVEGVVAVPRMRVGARGDPPARMSVLLGRTEVAVAGAIDVALRVES